MTIILSDVFMTKFCLNMFCNPESYYAFEIGTKLTSNNSESCWVNFDIKVLFFYTFVIFSPSSLTK